MLDSQISTFENIGLTKVLNISTVGEELTKIRNGTYKAIVDQIRAGNKGLKKTLPLIAFHGLFDHYRAKKDYSESSGVLIIDIDDVAVDKIEEYKKAIVDESSHVLISMMSPSGNGIKLLYLIDPEQVTSDNYGQLNKEVAQKFTQYGEVDYLSVTDCLIATHDPKIVYNKNAVYDYSVVVKESVKTSNNELAERDTKIALHEDAEEFFEKVLLNNILSKTSNNFHFIQVSVLELVKYGFNKDIDFVVDYSETTFGQSPANKERFREALEISKQYKQTMWAYDYNNDDSMEIDTEEDGLVNLSDFRQRIIDKINEGDRVGREISLQNFADIFRFSGNGVDTWTGISQSGKAQPLDSEIVTPNGIVKMGDIKVGDYVLSKDGKTKVSGVFDQGERDVYKIHFSDGTSAKSCKEHIWSCKNIKDRVNKRDFSNRTLADIMKDYKFGKEQRNNYSIPTLVSKFDSQKTPLDPYALGVLIGDGALGKGTPRFTNGEVKMFEVLGQPLKKINCKIYAKKDKGRKCYSGCISKIDGKENNLSVILKDLNLNVNAIYKHIPDIYKFNSVSSRMGMLRGLMDTDGTVTKKGNAVFNTSSERLAHDVVFLVRSLGGIANISSKMPTHTNQGVKKTSVNRCFNIAINLPKSVGNPFLNCEKKRLKYSAPKEPSRFIVKIELDKREETRCVMVEDESHLYFTNNFIVTHNTEFLDQIIIDITRLYKEEFIIVGFEQSPEEHFMKLVRKLLGVNITADNWFKNQNNVTLFNKAYDFLSGKIRHIDTDKIGGNLNKILGYLAKQIERPDAKTRYVILDPFNMMSLKTNKASGHEQAEEILKTLTEFSKKHNVYIILVAHPTKMKKGDDGKYPIPDLYSVKGTSAFWDMSYHGHVVHRHGYDANSLVEVKVLKVKQANLGIIGASAFYIYDRESTRYIPVDEKGNELEGDHLDKNWINKL